MRPIAKRIISLLPTVMESRPGQYTEWSKADLISRLSAVEENYTKLLHKHKPQTVAVNSNQPKYPFSSHPRQKVALKFCYSGWVFSGLAAQSDKTPLPTVEQVLFEALVKTRLIDPDGGFEGCGWDRCGRTDRGVSSAGQVISLWVRSAVHSRIKKQPKEKATPVLLPSDTTVVDDSLPGLDDFDFGPPSPSSSSEDEDTAPQQELPYVTLLNRVLPSTIRVIAWSPVSPAFSARFRCRYRHYKYFFSSRNLSIPLMREAASYLVGKHDFRNLCKVDAGKQITNFKRRIYRAEIVPVPDEVNGGGKIWVFNLVGRAFLYHQVRHIMAVLLLVGAGLEKPTVIKQLLHVDAPPVPQKDFLPDEDDEPESEEDDTLRTVDGHEPLRNKPEYQMADGLPLMLWDCAFPDADVSWRLGPEDLPPKQAPTVYNEVPQGTALIHNDQPGGVTLNGEIPGLQQQLSAILERNQIEAALNAHFLYAITLSGLYSSPPTFHPPLPESDYEPLPLISAPLPQIQTMNIPTGGGYSSRSAHYVPLMRRKRLDSVEEINDRWLKGKGAKRVAKMRLGEQKEESRGEH